MTYDVKFDLPDGALDVRDYVTNDLMPALNGIKGVEILSYGEAFQVYDAQDNTIGDPEKARSKIFGGDKRRQSKGDEDVTAK